MINKIVHVALIKLMRNNSKIRIRLRNNLILI